MEFLLVDITAVLLFGLKSLLYVLVFAIAILGLDDLFIDICYWARRVYRRLFVYSEYVKADETLLFSVSEKPLAIMIPAWNEVGVVGEMAKLAASTLDYENYQIFVGVYPNDPATQQDVDAVCLQFSHVHKVVCARPGPTSKADCLNNIVNAIFSFEKAAGVSFDGFILHDAEDVISPLELRLFNFLTPRKDLIQVPVYPFPPRWYELTSGHYIDEFAEPHGKDIVVREALTGQVPSAGVGTCFSRRAVLALLEEGDGIAFDVRSLTEDYDIGYRLKQKGMVEVFARFYIKDPRYSPMREREAGVSEEQSGVICVREYFPRTFSKAVNQKSRWITGIVFQGTKTLGWSRSVIQNYFLWRDRKGLIVNLIGLLANIAVYIALGLYALNALFPGSWQFLSLLDGDDLFINLLIFNGFLWINRALQRWYFVSVYYGHLQGLLSVPRILWSNAINFFATWRALRNVIRAGDSQRVPWDKTQHEMPFVDAPRRTPLGQYLTAQGAITRDDLETALQRDNRMKLGRALLLDHLISPEQLGRALAEQFGFQFENMHPMAFDRTLTQQFPRAIALRYGVLPLREARGTLFLATEKYISPVALGAIARQLQRDIQPVMIPPGFLTLALRYWCRGDDTQPDPVLTYLESGAADGPALSELARNQIMLGDLIQEIGMVSPQVFAQALFDYDPLAETIGQFLVARGLISTELLNQALALQEQLQARSLDFATAPDMRSSAV
ncbi:MAG: glycosyl transferase family protein [Chromatocurvus sp.]